jgi:hypothetical protein
MRQGIEGDRPAVKKAPKRGSSSTPVGCLCLAGALAPLVAGLLVVNFATLLLGRSVQAGMYPVESLHPAGPGVMGGDVNLASNANAFLWLTITSRQR